MTLPAKSPDDVVVLDALRTPIGKARGSLARVRPDDLAAHVLRGLLERNPTAKAALEEIILGATNQAGEDNRNIARMAALLADLPYEVTGVTVNRLCGSGLEAVIQSARAIHMGDHEVMVAGGVESMSRAPYAYSKPDEAFPRKPPTVYDTSLGWRFQNPKIVDKKENLALWLTNWKMDFLELHGLMATPDKATALASLKKLMGNTQELKTLTEVVELQAPGNTSVLFDIYTRKAAQWSVMARDPRLTKAEASEHIERLQEATGRS